MVVTRRFYPELESLRGIAACSVMVWHWFSFGRVREVHLFPLVSEFFYQLSELAVLGFFVLSAFVLANSISANWDKNTLSVLVSFWIRRAFRIWPLAAVVVIGSYLFFYWSRPYLAIGDPWPRYSDYSWDTLERGLLLLNTNFNPPGWTLIYEAAGYVIIPIAYIATRGLTIKSLLAALVTLFLWNWFAGEFGSWRNLSQAFAIGLVAYLIHEKFPDKNWVKPGLVVLFGALAVRIFQPALYDWTAVSAIGLAALILIVISSPNLRNLLNVAPLRWIGLISYSIYLIHYPVMWATACAINAGIFEIRPFEVWLLLGAIAIPLTIIISQCTYILVEKPTIRLGAWLGSRVSKSLDFFYGMLPARSPSS